MLSNSLLTSLISPQLSCANFQRPFRSNVPQLGDGHSRFGNRSHHHARALALAILTIAACFQPSQARAQDHNHPPADVAIHERFYSTWMMPDRPDLSCCNRQDCYPTEVRFRDGFWEARRREDGAYIRVPWEKVENNRDNPDGRNHVCMPPPDRGPQGREVFCFALGSGT
jgi:hypothetical protein